jgi:hypothetical protein
MQDFEACRVSLVPADGRLTMAGRRLRRSSTRRAVRSVADTVVRAPRRHPPDERVPVADKQVPPAAGGIEPQTLIHCGHLDRGLLPPQRQAYLRHDVRRSRLAVWRPPSHQVGPAHGPTRSPRPGPSAQPRCRCRGTPRQPRPPRRNGTRPATTSCRAWTAILDPSSTHERPLFAAKGNTIDHNGRSLMLWCRISRRPLWSPRTAP